jgi:hypothetical protein
LLQVTLAAALLLGLGIRLYDLTDPPFDFHSTRQHRSAIIARGMYYLADESLPPAQREQAIAQMQRENIIEPPIVEYLVSRLYLLTGQENLWYGRLLSGVFWVLGGLAIYGFGRELGSRDGGLLAAIYYLFLPYGMIASRSFLSDPLMVALIAATFWTAVHWHNQPTMRAAIWTGLFAGVAIFVKSVSVFILGAALAGLMLGRMLAQRNEAGEGQGLKRHLAALIRERQVWTMAVLTLLPTVLYYIYGLFINGFLQQQLKYRFFPEMWRDPAFYIRWVEFSSDIVGYGVLLAALIGVLLIRDRGLRGMLAGMWLGYLVYSMTFPFHTITHDYYTLPLIPVVAAGLVPVGAMLLGSLAKHERSTWARLAVIGVIAFGVIFKVWDTRVILARQDFRTDAAEWAVYREIIPLDANVIALTKAYGLPLAYYGWVDASLWLSNADAGLRELAGADEDDVTSRRLKSLEGQDLFLVTNFNELDNQPALKELLQDYAIYAEGPGYIVYDLNQPLD